MRTLGLQTGIAFPQLIAATDGSEHKVEIVDPLGHPDNPMQDKDIEEKFNAMAEPVLGADRCRRSLDALWQGRDADNVGALFAMLDLRPVQPAK